MQAPWPTELAKVGTWPSPALYQNDVNHAVKSSQFDPISHFLRCCPRPYRFLRFPQDQALAGRQKRKVARWPRRRQRRCLALRMCGMASADVDMYAYSALAVSIGRIWDYWPT